MKNKTFVIGDLVRHKERLAIVLDIKKSVLWPSMNFSQTRINNVENVYYLIHATNHIDGPYFQDELATIVA